MFHFLLQLFQSGIYLVSTYFLMQKMKKNNFLTAGLIGLLVIGLAFGASAAVEDIGKKGRFGEMLGEKMHANNMTREQMHQERMAELGLSEHATREEVRDALWADRLEDLGLTEESTLAEFRDAMQARHEDQLSQLKEELGLSEDASPQEVREALRETGESGPGMPHVGGRRGGMGRSGI